jgi:tetratricopeptide (TPR) repeat protein
MVITVLGMSSLSLGQSNNKPAAQNPPAGQAAAAVPQGKRPPQAKTQPEFEAYKAATGISLRQRLQELQAKQGQTDQDKQEMATLRQNIELSQQPATLEKAADDFAAKFPESELRVVVYKAAMQRYQQANNADKMMEVAQKALGCDADDPEALVGVAQVLAERTRETDLDRDQRLAEAKKDAERALVTVDTDVPSTGYPPEQLNAFKGYLRSEAYAIVGTLAFNAKNWAEAEADLRKSMDAFPQQPDAVAVFRLAVALDMQNRIPEAMKYADQALDLTKDRPDSPVGRAVRAEKDRLTKLSSGTAPGQNAAPPKN